MARMSARVDGATLVATTGFGRPLGIVGTSQLTDFIVLPCCRRL